MSMRLLIAATLGLAACNSISVKQERQALHDVAEWRSERISLPPKLAPSLPGGEELLLFAPGVSEAGAEDFWSYVFALRLDEPDLDAAGIQSFFERYYDGLLRSTAESRGRILTSYPASVSVRSVGSDTFEGSIHMLDAFVTMMPMELRLLIHSEPAGPGATPLRVQASPQPTDHAIWTTLAQAAQTLKL